MNNDSFENISANATEEDIADASTAPTDTADVAEEEHLPTSVLTLKLTPRHSVIGTASDLHKTQLCATITARDPPIKEEEYIRAPVDIVVALDVSASMTGEKLALCKESLELLITSLLPDDRFGLVTFSDTAVTEIHIQELLEEQKEYAIELVKSLQVRNCTNISGAICLAAQELRMVETPNAVRTIFLLTDGLANRGVTGCSDIVKLAKLRCVENEAPAAAATTAATTTDDDDESVSETSWVVMSKEEIQETPSEEQPKKTTCHHPITIHCFGYGFNHDSKMLQGISLAMAGGSYYFVENDSDVKTAFGDALGGVFSVVAQNVVLTIKIPKEARELGVNIVKVHHKNTVKHKDKSYSVTIGDFYAEESRDVLFEVALADPPHAVDYWITHATASVSYVDTLSKEFIPCQQPVPCDIARITGSAISAADPHVKVQWLRLRVTKTIHDADMLASNGNVNEARAMIDNMLEAIQMSTDDIRGNELVKQLLEDLNNCKGGLASYEVYVNYGTHKMRNTFQSHSTQRCMDSLGGSSSRRNVYRGSQKAKTINTFHSH